MDLHESTPRKYDLDIDYWVSPFRKPSHHALREAAGRIESPPTTSSPRPMGLQDGTPSKQDGDGGANTFNMTSRTQLTKASQSRNPQIPSEAATIDSQNCIDSKQDIDLGPRRVIMPSLTQRTPGRLSLVNPPPLLPGMLGPQKGPSSKSNEDIRSSQSQRPPRAVGERASPLKIPTIPSRAGLQGPHNETPRNLDENLDPRPFEVASRAQSKKARQPRSVPVLRRPPRMRPRDRFDVLRPDPYRAPSRVQREAVFKAAERLRALEPCITVPFLEFPAELRLIIYEHALTSQSPITPRLRRAQKAESKDAQADAAESSAQANASSLALLQTCRLVNREARPVYYASNTFRFTSAKDLAFFLHHTGPGLLNEVRKLHIEGLVTFKPLFTEKDLERLRTQGYTEARCQRLRSMRTGRLGDDADAAAILLKQCPRLHRIHLVMASRYEKCHIIWLLKMTGFIRTIVILVDHSHWAVRLADSQVSAAEWYKVLAAAFADAQSRRALFPDLGEGQQRCIDVDLDMNYNLNELQ
ncbi:hypothetical protein JMJ35_008474 [Cladonia borealis]|uniref:DUF7730 domain-containing protein n=1 Tax=Cladonia borealis TaxID=184061 RepID=A0AA39QTX1_9LECA|nr:hypothetical protein JMJ35_008474 [Cladonia borealis]